MSSPFLNNVHINKHTHAPAHIHTDAPTQMHAHSFEWPYAIACYFFEIVKILCNNNIIRLVYIDTCMYYIP